MILGVSGWLGSKIGMKDSTVRVIFVLSVLLAGAGVGIYLICWILKLLGV